MRMRSTRPVAGLTLGPCPLFRHTRSCRVANILLPRSTAPRRRWSRIGVPHDSLPRTSYARWRRSAVVAGLPARRVLGTVRARMSKQRSRDTDPEVALRKVLHARGVRFRTDVKLEKDLRTRADFAWRGIGLAVFVDGCFWHGCPEHATRPAANSKWWAQKLDGTSSATASRGSCISCAHEGFESGRPLVCRARPG